MKVVVIAQTILSPDRFVRETGYIPGETVPEYADELAEIAGRVCYQSWNRPNPATATNQGYLANILDHGHFSVLEHSSVTFYVEGVSRALLTELERHRFLSFSVVSQRYVSPKDMDTIIPPLFRGNGVAESWIDEAEFHAHRVYSQLIDFALSSGASKKQAREAARSVLPNATEVKMLVTGNLRCWRDVIGKRYHEAADEEIKQFATEVLRHLREIAPHSVQDIPEAPYA